MAVGGGAVTSDRVLWNRRPTPPVDGGDIDEIVLSGVDIHIEQMDDRCWWIGIHRPDGTYWMGNFVADRYGRMRFSQQENNGITWALDQTHERTDAPVAADHESGAGRQPSPNPGEGANRKETP